MHINMSLNRDDVNIFSDPGAENGLSQEAYYFIGGLMKHARGMAAITNPIVNSYKRLVPGYEAPVYIAWSASNRSPLIRIPAVSGNNVRVELRSPDSAANPYLAIAVCLAAGLDGIRNKIMPPESVDTNIFNMKRQEREAEGIDSLPANLLDALRAMRGDAVICEALGQHVVDNYIKAKKREYMAYNESVSQWEIDEYLYKI